MLFRSEGAMAKKTGVSSTDPALRFAKCRVSYMKVYVRLLEELPRPSARPQSAPDDAGGA